MRQAPDHAVLNAGVVTEGKPADEALARNRPALNRVVDGLRKYGLTPADIVAPGLSVSPKYTQLPTGDGESRPARGVDVYEVRTRLKITIRDLAKTGAIIDDVKSGSNVIDGVTFGLAEQHKAKDEARRIAAGAARTRATLYAQALGVSLGDLLSITGKNFGANLEGAADLPSRRAQAGVVPTVIEPGEIVI